MLEAVSLPDLVLLVANAIYSTSYVTSRVVLEQVPPATLTAFTAAGGALIVAGLVVTVRRSAT
jgi:hypothetical protein